MTPRSPVAAMLWENWRVSRVEAGQRVALGLVLGAGALTLFDRGAVQAFWILVVLHGMVIWLSIARLNGGRFMDGYKPGFPFYLLYTRPVRTSVAVAVGMAYDAISCLLLYLASAALLGFAFGKPLPLLSVAIWIVTCHVAYLCIQWATRNRVVQWGGSIVLTLPLFFLLQRRASSGLEFQFSFAENATMALACVVLFVLTVVGVARQRRGDSVVVEPQAKAVSGGYPAWLIGLFRFACPTSSPTRAQLWFELKSSGLPILAIGLMVAILAALLYALSIPIWPMKPAVVFITIVAVPAMLFGLGNNAFGVRHKQGRMYAGPFDMTLPIGTAQLAGMKILVRTACLLAALALIISSLWLSSSLLGEWGEFLPDGRKDALPGMLELRHKIGNAFGGLTGHSGVALAIAAAIAIAGVVAWQAAREALRVRYPRQVLMAQWLPPVWGFSLVLIAVAGKNGMLPHSQMVSMINAAMWIGTVALAAATVYSVWISLAHRVLTFKYMGIVLLILAAFGTAYLAFLRGFGVPNAGTPWTMLAVLLWPMLILVKGAALAPWALYRLRHT